MLCTETTFERYPQQKNTLGTKTVDRGDWAKCTNLEYTLPLGLFSPESSGMCFFSCLFYLHFRTSVPSWGFTVLRESVREKQLCVDLRLLRGILGWGGGQVAAPPTAELPPSPRHEVSHLSASELALALCSGPALLSNIYEMTVCFLLHIFSQYFEKPINLQNNSKKVIKHFRKRGRRESLIQTQTLLLSPSICTNY